MVKDVIVANIEFKALEDADAALVLALDELKKAILRLASK